MYVIFINKFYIIDVENDLLFNFEGCPIIPEILPIDSSELFPTSNEIATITTQVEKLHIYIRIQSL